MSRLRSRSRSRASDGEATVVRGSGTNGAGPARERAFLVGMEARTRSRGTAGGRTKTGPLTASAQAARDSSTSPVTANAQIVPEFTAEESLAELRSLATSAGAEIVGEFLQHRDRPDSATLIGSGKLEEIAGAVASVSADLLLFDHDLRLLLAEGAAAAPGAPLLAADLP